MGRSKHILVIGGGIIGLCTAYYCTRRGHRVTVLERNAEQRDGCSFGNAGMIVPSHFQPLAAPGMVALGLKWMWNPESPFYIKPRLTPELLDWGVRFWRAATAAHVERSAPLLRDLHLASRRCYEDLAALPDQDFGLVRRGLLMLCKTSHALAEEISTASKARELGIPAEVLDAKQTSELEPNLQMDIAGAVLFPQDCHLSPERFMASLKRRLDEGGTRFAWGTELQGWRTAGNRIAAARTAQGDLTADEFVVCAGAWSATTLRELSLRLPLQAGKGYSLTLSQPRRLPGLCAILTEARVAVTPIGNNLRFGGTMEIAGLNESINSRRVAGIIKSVPSYYPEFTLEDFNGVTPWCGLRPCSPDGLPYLGRFNRFENLSAATGHAMMGVSLGPITGSLMAEVLSDRPPQIDIRSLHPGRYC